MKKLTKKQENLSIAMTEYFKSINIKRLLSDAAIVANYYENNFIDVEHFILSAMLYTNTGNAIAKTFGTHRNAIRTQIASSLKGKQIQHEIPGVSYLFLTKKAENIICFKEDITPYIMAYLK